MLLTPLAERHGEAAFVESLAHAWQQLHPALALWGRGKCCIAAATSWSCLRIHTMTPLLSTTTIVLLAALMLVNQLPPLPRRRFLDPAG